MPSSIKVDAAIIGGGFYGACLALVLRHYLNLEKVVIIEKESQIMQRASARNQARVHAGYHYCRNLMTAFRSFINFPRFALDFQKCVSDSFQSLYAVARYESKVNAYQFTKIFKTVGAPLKRVPSSITSLFNMDMIEEVFQVEEMVFDCSLLKALLEEHLEIAGVDVILGKTVQKVEPLAEDNGVRLLIHKETVISSVGADPRVRPYLQDEEYFIDAKIAFNCSYSEINNLLKSSNIELLPLKHELTEIALIEVPDKLKNIGITVMDGPFFSILPFPSRQLHSLSHVRYTPHYNWNDLEQFKAPHQHLKEFDIRSNYLYMIKDVERYLPIISQSYYVESLYEIKTLLLQNEIDDGRPILFKQDHGIKNFSTIMGGKIDNIYDILDIILKGRSFSITAHPKTSLSR